MALIATHNDVKFGVGDTVRISQTIIEGDKKREQHFEGIVVKIKGRGENKSFAVRRMGVQQIGIEKIFPINSPTIKKITVIRSGTRGVRHAKLYYLRDKSKKEIEKIYSRSKRRKAIKKSKVTPRRKKTPEH